MFLANLVAGTPVAEVDQVIVVLVEGGDDVEDVRGEASRPEGLEDVIARQGGKGVRKVEEDEQAEPEMSVALSIACSVATML